MADWLAQPLSLQEYNHQVRVYIMALVSQLLLVESGAVNKWKGKKLSEIPIEDLPDLEEDEGEDEEIVEDAMTNDLPIEASGSDPINPCSPAPIEPSGSAPKDPIGPACDLPDPGEEILRDATANALPMELSGSTPIKESGSAPNDQSSSTCGKKKRRPNLNRLFCRKNSIDTLREMDMCIKQT